MEMCVCMCVCLLCGALDTIDLHSHSCCCPAPPLPYPGGTQVVDDMDKARASDDLADIKTNLAALKPTLV